MKNSKKIKIIIAVVIFSGLFGGFLSFVIFYEPIIETNISNKVLFFKGLKYLFFGVIASMIVPLFLNMIGSNILDEETDIKFKNIFLLCSICLLASSNADTFVSGVYGKTFSSILELKEEVDSLQVSLVDYKTNVDFSIKSSKLPTTTEWSEVQGSYSKYNLGDNDVELLKSLYKNNKIMTDTISDVKFKNAIKSLKEKDIIKSSTLFDDKIILLNENN